MNRVRFKTDHFAYGTARGVCVCDADPFSVMREQDFGVEIHILDVMSGGNIFAFVADRHPDFQRNVVCIWDESKAHFTAKLVVPDVVCGLRLRPDALVVITESAVYVHHYPLLHLIRRIETVVNSKGLCAVSQATSSPLVLACPGIWLFRLQVLDLGVGKTNTIIKTYSLSGFELNFDGSLCVVACHQGIILSVYSTIPGTLLYQFRRGSNQGGNIYSMAFSPASRWLAVSSNVGTVHVFKLERPTSTEPETSIVSKMKRVFSRLTSFEWSFARCHFHCPSVVAFGAQENSLLIVLSGRDPPENTHTMFFRAAFDPVKGDQIGGRACHTLETYSDDHQFWP